MYLEQTIHNLRRRRQEFELLPVALVADELETIDRALVALEGTVALEAAHERIYGDDLSELVLDPRVPHAELFQGIALVSLEPDEVRRLAAVGDERWGDCERELYATNRLGWQRKQGHGHSDRIAGRAGRAADAHATGEEEGE